MKIFLGIALFILGSGLTSAEAKTVRKLASSMAAGTYHCENQYKEIVASFYIRTDGTSKKVDVVSAREEQDGSGVEGCYRASFKWIASQKEVKDVYCCPVGAN